MTDYQDIDSKLEEYSDVFDIYMEKGEMPDYVSSEDCIIGYLKEVIDNNPQVDSSDPLWVEIMKENLLSYFQKLLEIFREMQLEAMKELDLISSFQNASLDKKRQMWKYVSKTIEDRHTKFEVNLPDYVRQFKSEDRESVFNSLTEDWEEACIRKLEKAEQNLLDKSKKEFERISVNTGIRDYEKRTKYRKMFYRYPPLQEIVDIIGRDKQSSKEEKDNVIFKFLPTSVSKSSSIEEIDRVSLGNTLERVLPIEFSMPEDLFYKRYVGRELQELSNPGKKKPRKKEEMKKDPRLIKGPMIISVDTSGSMKGRPLEIAFTLVRQIVKIAIKQKRPCFLKTFSVRSKSLDLAKPTNWSKLDNFLEHHFSGGTDGEEMLNEAIELLQEGTYEMADVLIISDLQLNRPNQKLIEMIQIEQRLGTKFYALQIGNWNHVYKDILDKIWIIEDLYPQSK